MTEVGKRRRVLAACAQAADLQELLPEWVDSDLVGRLGPCERQWQVAQAELLEGANKILERATFASEQKQALLVLGI